MNCRHCKTRLQYTFIDLGFSPPSNAYLNIHDLNRPELYYPLKIKVCDNCWLVQTEDYAKAGELFSSEYAYFSSTSKTWLEHAKKYSENIIAERGLTKDSFVVEVASNDGYLLRNFLAEGIPCLGIEPTDSTANAAKKLGIPILQEFFGEGLAKKLASDRQQADLIVGNNVFAHIPDINDFTRGMKALLKPNGTITLEFQHLMRLIADAQFDTVYHEHFSYLSLYTVCRIFEAVGLRIWNVEELPTHGGSLRVYGCHEDDPRATKQLVSVVLQEEKDRGLQQLDVYLQFQQIADKIKNDLLLFLIEQKQKGKKVAAYGAAAKGSTILNYAGVKPDLLPFVCDAAESKQGKFLPGSHLPIVSPGKLRETKPDYVIILAWNIASEIREQLHDLTEQGIRLITVGPDLLD